MLTKQEREVIAKTAESLSDCTLYYSEIYKCLYGEYPRNDMPNMEYDKAIIDRIVDLCDTSNMIELPLDKDGEVIRVGDVVYDEFNDKAVVKSIKYARDENVRVFALNSLTDIVVTYSPNCLTHRYISKAEQLAESITSAIEVFEDKLRELLAYVESLGDSDE